MPKRFWIQTNASVLFWKSKWECGVYAIIFLIVGFISLLIDMNAGNVAAFSTFIFLFIGGLNLLIFLFKVIRRSKTKSNFNQKLNSLFYTTKWKNGLYGLFFLLIGVVLFIKEETNSDSLAIQLALLFGTSETFIFIAKLLNISEFKQID